MMAALWEKVRRMFKKEQRVVMLGKMGAGATTILDKLKY
jgi:ABC-type taurine transport system ATPase subunit